MTPPDPVAAGTASSSAPDPAARRRLKRLLLLVSLPIDLAVVFVLLLGFWPTPTETLAPGAQTNVPGDAGLRRAFPPPFERPANPTTAERVALGRLLYFDPVLSGANDQSCATCHHPDLGLADGRGLGMGRGGQGLGPARQGGASLRRGAPTVWNAAYNHRQFWDGRASDLEDQAQNPIRSKDEMDQDPAQLEQELRSIPEYVRLFDRAFGGQGREMPAAPAGSGTDRKRGSTVASHDIATVTFANTTNAIAAFERTLLSTRSRFDRYREGEVGALSASERRGLALFRSLKTRCFECHGFPNLANPDFKVIGVPDLPGQPPDLGRAETGAGPAYARAFKVPTLRNVALTAPYMHNGRFRTLHEVVLFYQKGGGAGEGLELKNLDDKIRRFALTEGEQNDLVAFLGALTDESALPEIPERVPSGRPVVGRLRAPAPRSRGAGFPDHENTRNPSGSAFLPASPTGPSSGATSLPPALITVEAGQSIQAAVDRARPGDTIEVEPGTYKEQVLVDVDRITLRGLKAGEARAVLDGEGELTDAVIASGHAFTIEGFALRHYTSNGITVHGTTGVVFRDLLVENTGLYGVYPVECKDVLVEGVTATGIRDAAIYVGQSQDIVVRKNEVFGNVTGIEIENSVNALVEDNYAHDNTGGILVFLLPNNPSKVGHDTRVVRNRVIRNNHPNFGDPNAIVSQVPPGTGIFIMAADRTVVTGNEIRGNDSVGIAVLSLKQAFPRGTTFDVSPTPEGNFIQGNVLAENGRNPAPAVKAAGGGADLLWDGSGADNRWEQPGATSFPPFLPSRGWPDFLARAWSRVVSTLSDWWA
jgi:parallel beta-helix repeat protein